MPSNNKNGRITSSASANSFSLLSKDLQSGDETEYDTIEVAADTPPTRTSRAARTLRPLENDNDRPLLPLLPLLLQRSNQFKTL